MCICFLSTMLRQRGNDTLRKERNKNKQKNTVDEEKEEEEEETSLQGSQNKHVFIYTMCVYNIIHFKYRDAKIY